MPKRKQALARGVFPTRTSSAIPVQHIARWVSTALTNKLHVTKSSDYFFLLPLFPPHQTYGTTNKSQRSIWQALG